MSIYISNTLCVHGHYFWQEQAEAPADGADNDDSADLVKDETKEPLVDNKDDQDDTKKAEKKRKIGCNNEEVLAVLGHELGHWALNHTVKNMVISQVTPIY